jgi:Na+/H+ antiporter NhaD/arsenite permease-like protein
MRKILHENGLSIVFLGLFLLILVGQAAAGHFAYNEEQQEHGQPTVDIVGYIGSSHFLEATMENWESEFLQMFAFVVLTAFLFQKGSAESKDPDKPEPADRDPRKSRNKKDAPWPVRKGGLALTLYENSLSLAFLLMFLMAFVLHAIGGAEEYNQDQQEHGGGEVVSTLEYMGTPQFWFESLQNWQSEFLAVGAMVVLSIFLRQKGSAESKPVDSPHSETGR